MALAYVRDMVKMLVRHCWILIGVVLYVEGYVTAHCVERHLDNKQLVR